MAVICCNQYGWVVDHKLAIERMYKSAVQDKAEHDNPYSQVYAFKDALFDIQSPFIMDSQFASLKNRQHTSLDGEQAQKRRERKRKRKTEVNHGEMKAIEYHKCVKDMLMKAYCELVELAKREGFLASFIDDYSGDNNKRARMMAKDLEDGSINGHGLDESLCAKVDFRSSLSVDEKDKWKVEEIVNRLVTNSKTREINVGGLQYVLPANASFVLSDFSQLIKCQAQILTEHGEFDLIVIDPPWQNKSIKRQKRYNTLCNDDLLELPVPNLIQTNGLVAVWVTNRWQHIEFIKEQLFSRWSLQYEATWHWIKVTKNGQMVYNFDSEHKKPYEIIIFGRYKVGIKSSLKHKNIKHTGNTDRTKQYLSVTKETLRHTGADNVSMDCLKPDGTTEKSNEAHSETNYGKEENSSVNAMNRNETTQCSETTYDTIQTSNTKSESSLCSKNTCTETIEFSNTSNVMTQCSNASEEKVECLNASSETVNCSHTINEPIHNPNSTKDATQCSSVIMETIQCSIANNKATPCVNVDDITKCHTNDSSVKANCSETFLQQSLSEHKVIVSIPCSIHSMKPSLEDILKQFLSPNAKCLELFARNLSTGWTSWGNEVLKHQSLKHFDVVKG